MFYHLIIPNGFRLIRDQCTTPQAMGELFTNPHEWMPLVTERLIDFVRVRISKGAGITQCRKIAVLCEWFGVQTAWQGGGDNDPVNQMAVCHLDLSVQVLVFKKKIILAQRNSQPSLGTELLGMGIYMLIISLVLVSILMKTKPNLY